MKLRVHGKDTMSDPNQLDNETIDFLTSRRSTVARMMCGPGPDDESLEKYEGWHAGSDAQRLTPWRFIVIRGEARAKLGR